MAVAGEDGLLVRLRFELWGEGQAAPGLVIEDRWTPRGNLTNSNGDWLLNWNGSGSGVTRQRSKHVATRMLRLP